MHLQLFLALSDGDLCKVVSQGHRHFGKIVRFKRIEYYLQIPCFIFETSKGERVMLTSENNFAALPFPESIKYLITLALDTNDEQWFHELVHQLKNEVQFA